MLDVGMPLVQSAGSIDRDHDRWTSSIARDELSRSSLQGAPLSWLNGVYLQVAANRVNTAIDSLCSRVDDLLLAGEFSQADEVLSAVDEARIDSNVMVALLVVTRAAKDKLGQRKHLVDRIEDALRSKMPSRVDELLAGLR